MRLLARGTPADLRACAALHEDAAEALERHAREVDHLKELIDAVERRVAAAARRRRGRSCTRSPRTSYPMPSTTGSTTSTHRPTAARSGSTSTCRRHDPRCPAWPTATSSSPSTSRRTGTTGARPASAPGTASAGDRVTAVSTRPQRGRRGRPACDLADWPAELARTVTLPRPQRPSPTRRHPTSSCPWDLLVGTGAARARHRPDVYDVLVARAVGVVPRRRPRPRPGRLPRAAPSPPRGHGSDAATGAVGVGTAGGSASRRLAAWLLVADGWRALVPVTERRAGDGPGRAAATGRPGRRRRRLARGGASMTASPATPPITRVTGGVAGMAATYARGPRAGRPLRRGRRPDARLGRHRRTDPDRPRPPRVRAALADHLRRGGGAGRRGDGRAATGPWPRRVVYEADALLVRATIAAFEECDRLVASSFEVLDYAAGRALGCAVAEAAPYALALGVVAVPAARLTWHDLPADTRARLRGEARARDRPRPGVGRRPSGGGAARRRQQWRACSTACWPACRSAFRPRSASPTFHPTVGDAAADLAGLYGPDGPPQVRRRPDLSVRLGARAASRPARPDASPRRDRRPVAPRPSGRPGHDRGADPDRPPTAGCVTSSTCRAPTT